MNLELSEQAKAFVKTMMETGRYADEGDAINHYLETSQAWERRKAEIRIRVEEGVKDINEGRGTMISSPQEAEAFAQPLIARAKERRAKREHDTL